MKKLGKIAAWTALFLLINVGFFILTAAWRPYSGDRCIDEVADATLTVPVSMCELSAEVIGVPFPFTTSWGGYINTINWLVFIADYILLVVIPFGLVAYIYRKKQRHHIS